MKGKEQEINRTRHKQEKGKGQEHISLGKRENRDSIGNEQDKEGEQNTRKKNNNKERQNPKMGAYIPSHTHHLPDQGSPEPKQSVSKQQYHLRRDREMRPECNEAARDNDRAHG
jgi:hypothetical protein